MVKRREYSNPPRYEDLSTRQQTGLNKEMNRIGKGVPEAAKAAKAGYEAAAANPDNGEDYQKKAASRGRAVGIVQPALRSASVTVNSAAQRRVELVERARDEARAASEAHGTNVALPGAGWYFKHHADIMQGAQGTEPRRAIAASSALSPGKDPDADEVPNVHALMHLQQNNPNVSVRENNRTVTRRFSDIPTPEAATLFSRAAAENNPRSPNFQTPTVTSDSGDVVTAGRGHKPNIEKAVGVLRGEVSPEQATTGPKVTSYRQATEHAVPGSSEHVDWQNISQHYVHGDPNQGMFSFSDQRPVDTTPARRGYQWDPTPHNVPSDSILSPEHNTAEDTWMHSISSGQPLGYRPEHGRMVSPAKRAVDKEGPAEFSGMINQKAVGTAGDPGIDRTGLTYAFMNKSTRVASNNIVVSHNQHGEATNMPSVMTQEVSWTQGRREAGADAPYNKALREHTSHSARITPTTTTGEEQLFTHVAGAEAPSDEALPRTAKQKAHEAWLDKNDEF